MKRVSKNHKKKKALAPAVRRVRDKAQKPAVTSIQKHISKKGYAKLALWLTLLLCVISFGYFLYHGQASNSKAQGKLDLNQSLLQQTEQTEEQKKDVSPRTAEQKQAVMEADAATMYSYGLYYDYANLSLVDTVQAFLAEYGISPSQIAFSYKNTATGDVFGFNEDQPMTAGSTYKLPLNMLVVDEVEKGKLSLTEEFDISNTTYEYEDEHNNYVAAFNGAMTIPDMQEYSLVYSENTPAYALSERLGGMDKAYTMFDRYGKSKNKDVPTINQEGNVTTSDYYVQVLDYLWSHKDKYKDLLYYIGMSFPGEYYKKFIYDVNIYQKPGYVRDALNVDAIVEESTPYLISIYTAGLGGTTPDNTEVNGYGLYQLGQLAYVINEWHRVNMNY